MIEAVQAFVDATRQLTDDDIDVNREWLRSALENPGSALGARTMDWFTALLAVLDCRWAELMRVELFGDEDADLALLVNEHDGNVMIDDVVTPPSPASDTPGT